MECPICFNRIKRTINYCVTECKHSFCLECMIQHTRNKSQKSRNKCPICRKKIYNKHSDSEDSEPDELLQFETSSGDNTNDNSNSINDTMRLIQTHQAVQTIDVVHRPIFFFVNKIYIPIALTTFTIFVFAAGAVVCTITNDILNNF